MNHDDVLSMSKINEGPSKDCICTNPGISFSIEKVKFLYTWAHFKNPWTCFLL